jgi:hypothetical protein
MTDFFHMSKKVYAVGDVIKGNGKDKVEARIESAFEAARPPSKLSRRDAVYTRATPDFFMCGIDEGFIYRVTSTDVPQVSDLAWIKLPQLALFKEKYPRPGTSTYPDWTLQLATDSATGYWSGAPTASPIWEHLVTQATVVEVLSDKLVKVSDTVGGWKP